MAGINDAGCLRELLACGKFCSLHEIWHRISERITNSDLATFRNGWSNSFHPWVAELGHAGSVIMK